MSSVLLAAHRAGRRVVHVHAADLDDQLAVLLRSSSMSGSPKTMKRLPLPVFFSSSSPIARSGFIRTGRIRTLPKLHLLLQLLRLLGDVRVEGEAADQQQFALAALDRLHARPS